MNYSLKMARLDYFTCKPNIISYFTLIPVTIIFSFMSTSSIFIFNFTAAWFIALMSTNIFVVQEKNELERLYASLSLTTQNIVAGRYIYTYATFLLAYIFTTLVGVISIILKHESVNGLDIITSFSLSLFTFTAIIAIQLPLYFRYGYSKAKIYCLIPFVLVMLFVMLVGLGGIGYQIQIALKDMKFNLVWLNVIALILLVIVIDVWGIALRKRIVTR